MDALVARIFALENADLLRNGYQDPRDTTHYEVVKIGNPNMDGRKLEVFTKCSRELPGLYYNPVIIMCMVMKVRM
jgi:hypothetical protein